MQSTRDENQHYFLAALWPLSGEEKIQSVNWRKQGDFSIFGSRPLDRRVVYRDDKNSLKISIYGFTDNTIRIEFSTPNTRLLDELASLASQTNSNIDSRRIEMNDAVIRTSSIPALTRFINTINASSHPLDKNINEEINNILKMVSENKIANPISVLETKMESLLQNKATQIEIDQTFHELCGLQDSDFMIPGVQGDENTLLACAERIRKERNKADLLQQEIASLKAQLAEAKRTDVSIHSPSLFGTTANGLHFTRFNR